MAKLATTDSKHSQPADEGHAVGIQPLSLGRSTTLPPLSVRRNFAWYFAGNAVQAVSRLVLLVLLIKLGGLQAAGLWVAGTALCGPIFAAFELGLRNLLVCDIRRRFLFQDYFSVRTICAVAALVLTTIAALAYTGSTGAVVVVLALAFGRMFDSISDIGYAVLQREERMDRIGAGVLLRYAGSLLACAFVLTLGGGVLAVSLIDAVAAALILLLWTLPGVRRLLSGLPPRVWYSGQTPGALSLTSISRLAGGTNRSSEAAAVSALAPTENVRFRLPRREWLKLMWESFPAGVVNFEVNLTTNFPRYVVDFALGKEALALFASGFQVAGIGLLFISAMANALVPRLARSYAALNVKEYVSLLGRFLGMTALFGLLLFALVEVPAGRRLIALFFSPRLLEDLAFLHWIVLAACVLYVTTVLGRGVESLNRFRSHMVIRGVTVLILLAILPFFTNAWGMRGTTIGLTIALTASLPLYLGTIIRTWSHALGSPAPSAEAISLKKEAA